MTENTSVILTNVRGIAPLHLPSVCSPRLPVNRLSASETPDPPPLASAQDGVQASIT